jgi:hypothetical protein
MPYYRVSRLGCGGLVARVVMLVMLGILALICIGNRGWIEQRALHAVYGNRPAIHTGGSFRPGMSAVEDGVRQTAVLIGGVPHIRVTKPTKDWLKGHKDAICKHDVCTALATKAHLPDAGGGGLALGSLLGLALLGYIVWILVAGDEA